jgi:hypothetical protein
MIVRPANPHAGEREKRRSTAMTSALTDEEIADKLAVELGDYVVGFLKFGNDQLGRNVESAGSGTLVRIESVFGVPTAAHAIKALPRKGNVGLVLFNRKGKLQKQTIDMAQTESVYFYVPENGADGPGLGFVRLPETNVSNLKATHVFLKLENRPIDELPPPFLDWVVGVVGEWTAELVPLQPLDPAKSPLRRKQFQAFYPWAKPTSLEWKMASIFLIEPAVSPPPSTYGGVSGGAVWRVYIDRVGDERYLIRRQRLIGLPFYEIPEGNALHLVCHGPQEHLSASAPGSSQQMVTGYSSA